jgi:hypothetical protein
VLAHRVRYRFVGQQCFPYEWLLRELEAVDASVRLVQRAKCESRRALPNDDRNRNRRQ